MKQPAIDPKKDIGEQHAATAKRQASLIFNAELAVAVARQKNPSQNSRTWTHPEGYRYLVQWSNAILLRFLVTIFTSKVKSFKRKDQLDDAARSTVRDIEEGYKRANTAPYIEFLSYSQGSLEEVKGDIRDATQDGLLKSRPGSSLADLGINLKELNSALRPLPSSIDPLSSSKLKDIKGGYRSVKEPESDKKIFAFRPLQEIYPPLAKVKPEDLTYEIFFELINIFLEDKFARS